MVFHRLEIPYLPDLLALHQFKPDDYPYLLASNTSGEVNTRYSILMAYPEQTLTQYSDDDDCLDTIKTPLTDNQNDHDLPFIGGWFVFLSYEYAATIEPSVTFYPEKTGLPTAFISKIPAAVIIDHEKNICTLVANRKNKNLINLIQQDIKQSTEVDTYSSNSFETQEEDPDIYRHHLNKIHQYIVDGDIFQANLSREWVAKAQSTLNPTCLYQKLRTTNPAPFAALVKFEDKYILSSSPERLVSVSNRIAETRPIAGTYPRGKDQQEDKAFSKKLLNHPKERAEHVMLIDLERNDLGRICEPGSIKVKDRMVVETYSYVHHIVSSICGKLRKNLSVKDVLHAVFPGGTITGCPKVRCMEIISELEQTARGAYTGSVGYISDDGEMDFNILIRTMTVTGNTVRFRAGAGIVSDSVTEKELTETRHKARGLINALQAD
ncbi:MAG: aminodeoxychorismate synthase component I [Gammaproteobacteria bacterium]|jgi:anthranilate synthase component 1|nr:aminodeoxychorismate synthase component I [Gammaproteobacteria bacterium]MBT3723153.1 aminodeoxychorismate synthase component I [Gammaproteobacteria bacterium]MBT4076797.1 aminodeoxychorismate synthase component I [Gammaproteobacteria bacterium]MBT4196177.1 aminodeoxychorismate synthase component I [Gammaproteobacteria bacterium]MBT4448304.1 aminodeoxychorismate synthase component I [Gammaproteobacteria bacterium]